MRKCFWTRATTIPDVDNCQRVRCRVIHGDLNIAAQTQRVERDVNYRDCLITTEHLLVWMDRLCVGTGRLTLPNAEVARMSGTRLGFELEEEFDLEGLRSIHHQLVEVSRVCLMKDWHHSQAVTRLYEGLVVLSWLHGKRFLIGAVDCQTGFQAEAELMRAVLERRGAMHPHYRVEADSRAQDRDQSHEPRSGSHFYTQAEREAGERGELHGLRVAPALTAFIKRLGAQCIGAPALHPSFPRYVLPMLASLQALPESTLKSFDPTLVASTLGATDRSASTTNQHRRIAS